MSIRTFFARAKFLTFDIPVHANFVNAPLHGIEYELCLINIKDSFCM